MTTLQVPISPLQQIFSQAIEDQKLEVYIKRDDLLGSPFQGNKFRKLKYNLDKAMEGGYREIVSFGGAYSNHLHALSCVPGLTGLRVTCYVRGEVDDPGNPTLHFARAQGVQLKPLSRSVYQNRFREDFQYALMKAHPDGYLVPEGGTNRLALRGVAECALEIIEQLGRPPAYCLVPVGSGGTMAGLVKGFGNACRVIGIPAFKGDEAVREVEERIRNFLGKGYVNWDLLKEFGHGGFAKMTTALFDHIVHFYQRTGILVDPVYTARMTFAFDLMMDTGYFGAGSSIVLIHSGGLQGWAGFRQRFGKMYKLEDLDL